MNENKNKVAILRQTAFSPKGHFAVTIHVSLNKHICCSSGSDACSAVDSAVAFKKYSYGF